MESTYDKIVKLTAEILKSWKSDPGVVSPFSSSSSAHSEINDNHLEHYVKQGEKSENFDVASIFNSDLFTNGGEKMTEKTLDVDSSITTQEQYSNPGVSTTEPDPQSEIAITKADVPRGANDESGKGTYSTTANTTTEAPSAGDTTEPIAKAEDCPDCGKPMTMCMCDGMSKAAAEKCPHCGQSMPMEKTVDGATTVNAETAPGHPGHFEDIAKAADEAESAKEKAKETAEDEAKEMKKSIWGGSFAPNIIGRL